MLDRKMNQADFDKYMRLAIEEARISLREGNNGLGEVIARGKLAAVNVIRRFFLHRSEGRTLQFAEKGFRSTCRGQQLPLE